MRRCGDVQLADLGEPQGRDAGSARPVVVVTAQVVLEQQSSVAQVVPLTSTIRGHRSEVTIEPDPDNGLEAASAAQCQHIRAIAVERLAEPVDNVGPEALTQMQEVLAPPRSLTNRSTAVTAIMRSSRSVHNKTAVASRFENGS